MLLSYLWVASNHSLSKGGLFIGEKSGTNLRKIQLGTLHKRDFFPPKGDER